MTNHTPEGPTLDDTMLMAYADGELDVPATEAVEAAMAADPAIHARVAMFAQSAALLREAFAQPEAVRIPPVLERRLRRAVWSARAWRTARIALPVAAAIAGFVIGGAQIPRLPFGATDAGAAAMARLESTLHEVAEYHSVFVRETEHLVEVPATRQEHIEAWLGARVGYPLHVPDLTARGLSFVGARMLVVDARAVAQLMFTTASGERVALCLTEQEQPASTMLRHVVEGDFDMYAQGVGKHLFIVAAPAGSVAAKALAQDITTLMRRG